MRCLPRMDKKTSNSYIDVGLEGEEVLTGYVDVVRDIYDEKQLEILETITRLECDSDSLENKFIKLEECFDIESIIALEAAKKWREVQNSEDSSGDDKVYHLTREDFEEVIVKTYSLDFRVETSSSDEETETGEDEEPVVTKDLTGHGVVNFSQLAGHEGAEYYFFDMFFDKTSETYEEDKMMYDFYTEVIRSHILGTPEEPSHTLVDYESSEEDFGRMTDCADAKGYIVNDDGTVIKKDGRD